MTTLSTLAETTGAQGGFRLPDPPEREPDDMTSFDHLALNGNAHYLAQRLGNPETTLVGGGHYIAPEPTRNLAGIRYPDLFVAFGVDPAAYYRANSYIISEQGKPPDFVLEIASPRTGWVDVGEKRDDYARLGIGEYWRFDETGEQHHGSKLAGDLLVDGEYHPTEIDELPDGSLQGYSRALSLYLRWADGALKFHDPVTGEPIATLETERDRAEAERRARESAEARAEVEREGRSAAEARADAAEARVRELEERLRRG